MIRKLVLLALVAIPTVVNGVTLTFSARNLPSMDIFNGAPDAYINVYYAPSSNAIYESIGRSAGDISDNRNPDWRDEFEVPDNGGSRQMLKVDMYDADSPDADDYMGHVEIPLYDILMDPSGVLTKELIGGEPGGGQLLIKYQSRPNLKKSV